MGIAVKKEYKSIKELIERNLDIKEDDQTKILIAELKGVTERGYFTKKFKKRENEMGLVSTTSFFLPISNSFWLIFACKSLF